MGFPRPNNFFFYYGILKKNPMNVNVINKEKEKKRKERKTELHVYTMDSC